jgi:hypothetical protein
MPARPLLFVCVLLTTPLVVVPTSAIAGPGQSDSARVRVVVDAVALGDAGSFFEDEVGTELRAALEQAGYGLDDGIRADATVRVRISFFNEADLDYQVHVDISAGPELVQLEILGCPQCVDDDLLDKIHGQQAQIIAGLERALGTAHDRTQPASEDETPKPQRAKPIGPIMALGGVGIGATTLGIGVLIAGGVEFGRGRVYDELTQIPTEHTFVDHRPIGGALLGVGGVVIAAGVTMLVVDIVRSRKRQRQQVGLAHPLLGPSIVGLGFSGRF